MKKTMLYVAIGFVVLFIIQVFRNSPVTEIDNNNSPMYGFEIDTTTTVIPPQMVADEGHAVKDPLGSIKEKLFAYKYLWFAGQAEYMVKDSDFVDAIINEVLAEENDGKMPKNSAGVEEIARQVIYAYSAKIKGSDGLARLESLIQKRYDNPLISISRNGKYMAKTIELGVLPAKLSVSTRHGIIRTRNSGVIDENGRWISKEIARQILKYNADAPDRIVFRVWFSPYYGGLENSYLFTYMAKIPDSPFPPLINVRPENYYGKASYSAQSFYLFHALEDYAEDKYSVYEVDNYKYRQMH